MSAPLVIAIPSKGRLQKDSAALFSKAGLEVVQQGAERSYRGVIEGIDGVRSLHDLHVWTITSGMDCLSGHVVADAEADHQRLLATLQRVLLERFGVDHATLQIEAEGHEEVEPRF